MAGNWQAQAFLLLLCWDRSTKQGQIFKKLDHLSNHIFALPLENDNTFETQLSCCAFCSIMGQMGDSSVRSKWNLPVCVLGS